MHYIIDLFHSFFLKIKGNTILVMRFSHSLGIPGSYLKLLYMFFALLKWQCRDLAGLQLIGHADSLLRCIPQCSFQLCPLLLQPDQNSLDSTHLQQARSCDMIALKYITPSASHKTIITQPMKYDKHPAKRQVFCCRVFFIFPFKRCLNWHHIKMHTQV